MLLRVDIRRLGSRTAKDDWLALAFAGLLAALTLALITLFGSSAEVEAAGLTAGWTKVVSGGFTDPNNSYAPAVTEFRGYLYLSTTANESGFVFSNSRKLGGEIWRSADGVKWEQIGKPGLGNPHNSSFNFVTFHDKLYAIAFNLNDHGIEIWVTGDGQNFTEIEKGGFGDKNSDSAVGFVFADRLIIGVANSDSGAQIWVSEDGQTFREVVSGGMGDKGNTGIIAMILQGERMSILNGQLYVGTSNPGSGGEIWRTGDGLKWERVADEGLGRSASISLTPFIVYQGQLYVTGVTGGSLDKLKGMDIFRTSDGTTWEKVVSDGFSVGKERNVHGSLVDFQGKLYLDMNTMDPRLLIPGNPSERMAPRGFQLYVSADGANWTQVGKDGFGQSTSLYADVNVIGDTVYLSSFDYHKGGQVWRSVNGQDWEVIFREPDPSFFSEGGGVWDFKGHLIWIDNDLVHGLEIWRTDAQVVADATTTTARGETTSTTLGVTGTTIGGVAGTTAGTSAGPAGTTAGTGGAGGGPNGGAEGGSAKAGGLSGGWIALVAVLAVVVVAALAATAFVVGRARGNRTRTSASMAPSRVFGAPDDSAVPGAAEVGTGGESVAGTIATPTRSFCSECGALLEPGAKYCAGCGRPL